MLDNTITLAVDELNDANTTDHIFTRYNEYQDRSVYTGPAHALTDRETLTLYRTMPTKSGNFKGTAKSSLKFTSDRDVDGVDSTTSVQAPLIGTVSFSLPIGVTSADLLILRQKMIALLDDDTIMDKLNEQLEI